ncbi:MAG TPA: TonB-dependent receptor, partial [Ramlibacter sp.]
MFYRSTISAAVLAALPFLACAQSAPENEPVQSVVVTGKYIAGAESSAMKLDLANRDTPFSVSAYTDSFMAAIDTSSLADLYKYMTGIQRAGATAFDMSIRGFKTSSTDRNAIMVDGLPGLVGRFGSPPTVGIEHVEVVKGPASVLYGQAQPGGFVNLISKKPLAHPKYELDVRATTYNGNKLGAGDANGYEASVDLTGPIDAGKRLRYRLVAQTNDSDGFRDGTFTRGPYIAPSLSWRFMDDTTATLALEYRKTNVAWDRGLVAPGRDISRVAPITTRYQQPGSIQGEEGRSATFNLVHEFEGDATFNFSVRDIRSHDENAGYDNLSVRPDGITLARRASNIRSTRGSDFFDASFSMPFTLWGIGNKAIIGINGGHDTAESNRLQFFSGPASGPQSLDVNLYHPDFSSTPPMSSLPAVNPATPGNLKDQYTRTGAKGLYLADLLTLSDHWKANLGLRSSEETQYITDLRVPVVPANKSDRKVLPMAGLLYQPTKEWTFYSSYSNSFVPAAAVAFDVHGNNPFVPETARQIEAGTKAELLDGRLLGTLALFDIRKKNTLSSFACALGPWSQQIGAERSQGVEFEINAQPRKNWQVAFGGSQLNPRIVGSTDAAQVGARLVNSARRNAHLWSRYDAGSAALKGLGIGFG